MRDTNYSFWQMIRKAFAYWYVFAIMFGASMFAAYFYLQSTQPKYRATASLLIKDEENQPNEELVFSELGLGRKNKNLENEVLVLRSTPLMFQVVESLELQYQFTEVDGWKKRDLYKESTVKVLDWQPENENGGLEATLFTGASEGYRLLVEDVEYFGEFGKELRLPTGRLTLLNHGDSASESEIQIRISSIWNRAREFVDNFEVEVLGESSSVLNLSLKDLNPYRAQEVLTQLIEVYNQKTIDDKNQVFENSIKFIDDRIKLIASELSETESDVEDYKRRYNVVELSREGNMIMSELSDFNRQMSDAEVQMEILNTIQIFLSRNRENFEFVPTNLSLTNLTLTKQLDYFNQLLAERDILKNELGKSHPDLILVEKQIQNLRQTIINNIYAIKKDLEIAQGANNELRANLERRLQSLPKRERELINIERKKNIKEKLYIYLLQKREESAISLAVTAATGNIVEPPSFSKPVSPIRAQVWLIAAFLGLAIPLGIVLLLDNLNHKVQSENDIIRNTSLPLAGVIANSRGKNKVIVRENAFNPSAELFRLLRSNLSHITQMDNLRSLLFTSSGNGAGKSYVAMNLGMAQTLTGRRVVIVEVDMRSAQQEKYSRVAAAEIGVIDYLVNPAMTVDHIIQNSGIHPCLDIINSGSRIADPSKMVLSSRLRELIAGLKERYDFIILDAPPVDMLADTLEMADLAEATMFIVRAGVTNVKKLQLMDVVAKNGRLPKPFILLNGVSLSKMKNNSFLLGYRAQEVEHRQNGFDHHYQNTAYHR